MASPSVLWAHKPLYLRLWQYSAVLCCDQAPEQWFGTRSCDRFDDRNYRAELLVRLGHAEDRLACQYSQWHSTNYNFALRRAIRPFYNDFRELTTIVFCVPLFRLTQGESSRQLVTTGGRWQLAAEKAPFLQTPKSAPHWQMSESPNKPARPQRPITDTPPRPPARQRTSYMTAPGSPPAADDPQFACAREPHQRPRRNSITPGMTPQQRRFSGEGGSSWQQNQRRLRAIIAQKDVGISRLGRRRTLR